MSYEVPCCRGGLRIRELNTELMSASIPMNEAGGILKVSPDGGLLQSSTVADLVTSFLIGMYMRLFVLCSPPCVGKQASYLFLRYNPSPVFSDPSSTEIVLGFRLSIHFSLVDRVAAYDV